MVSLACCDLFFLFRVRTLARISKYRILSHAQLVTNGCGNPIFTFLSSKQPLSLTSYVENKFTENSQDVNKRTTQRCFFFFFFCCAYRLEGEERKEENPNSVKSWIENDLPALRCTRNRKCENGVGVAVAIA